jgi:hypothetical protein
MFKNFTLLFLTQCHPDARFQVYYDEEALTDSNIADFFHHAEQSVNKKVLERIYAEASRAVARRRLA